MNLGQFGRFLFLCGLLVLCVNEVWGKQFAKPGKTRKNKANHVKGDVVYQKLNYRTLSKHLLRRLDSSCRNTLLPEIKNGKFIRFKRNKIQDRKLKSKYYLVAEFKCNEGYKFRSSHPGKMFCSKTKWVGKKPICDKIKLNLETPQGDDPNVSPPELSSDLEDCPPEDRLKCQHLCRMYHGEPICECLLGFKQVGKECKDIDECETNNGDCQHTCTNNLGSFFCSCPEGYRLSSDGKTCEDINECHLRNGHGPCQDTCQNTLGSYKCGCSNLNGTRLAADKHTCSDVNECTEGISGCSHSCVNTHGRAFCTCPDGMELGSDWKTCKDINECEDPEIRLACKFGCVNFIGSYYCAKHSDDTVADQPISDNTKISKQTEEDYEEDDYADEDYESYDDNEEYDENDAVKEEEKNLKEQKESVTNNNVDGDTIVDPPEISDRIDKEKADGEFDKDYEGKTETTNRVDSTSFQPAITTTTVVPQVVRPEEKLVETKDEEIDEYDDDYNDGDYDDEYDEENNEENAGNKTKPIIENVNINRVYETTTATMNKTTTVQYVEKDDKIENDVIGFDVSNRKESSIDAFDNSSQVFSRMPSGVIDTPSVNKDIKNNNYGEADKEEETYETSSHNIENVHANENQQKEIENKRDETYNKDYEEENNIPKEKQSNTENDLLPTETSFVSSRTEVTTVINLNKENDEDESYDEDYDEDDEYYDEDLTTEKPSVVRHNTTENTERTIEKSIVTNIPEVDIEKINTEIHQIIANNTHNVHYKHEETTNLTTTTASANSVPPEEDEEDSEYDYGDNYDENDDKELKKEESMPVGKGVAKCEKGYTLGSNGECTDIDECDTHPCPDGCENTIGSFICTCPLGFTLSPSDPYSCQDIDECLDKPCSHICVNEIGSYRCQCPSDLTLQNNTCVNLTCSHGQTKINGLAQCTCPSGFVLGFDQRTCEDVDECELDNDCSHLCHNSIGSYECGCEVGFELKNEKRCVDIDECKANHGCPQLCENTPGSFRCSCEEGYEYRKEEHTCVDINECEKERDLNECSQICVNYEGGYECACNSGYKLGSDDSTCEDIDECSHNNGNCSQICTNLPGSHQCDCKTGYALSNDNSTCEAIDPCVEENGGCSHECVNDNGIAVCKCPEGQILEEKDCYIYDPCVASNGGCSHICVNANGAVRCECPDGYELENKTTCVQVNLCTINNGNCSHFCEFVDGHVNCMCRDLYVLQNKTHCVEVDPCLEDNGGCSHICTFENHTLTCSCPPTHELSNKTHCFEKNPCLVENGGCSDFCNFSNRTLTCSCPENFYLEGKTCFKVDPCLTDNGGCSHECFSDDDGNVECLCPNDFALEENQRTCSPIDPCLLDNGNCSHMCNSSNGFPVCSCPEGFKLKNKTHCEEDNPCLMENGGCSDICENINGQAKCSCPDQYILKDPRNCILADPCRDKNGGCSHICENINNQAICSCPKNYTLEDLKNCVLVDPCLSNNGGCSHICENINDQAICSCPENYALKDSKTCALVDPCGKNNGGCSHVCINDNDKAKCSCPDHYNLVNKTTCLVVNPCVINNGGCSHECVSENNEVFCLCPEGYRLDGKKCKLINPCDTKNGGCSHICTSINGQVICKCPPAHELIDKTCFKINPCMINNGGCSHGCTNVRGQPKCSCPPGYKLFGGKTCSDENPCAKNNGGCSHDCHNKEGRRECSCPTGYILRPNKRVCKEVNECRMNRGGCSHGCKNIPGSYQCTCPYGFVLDQANNKTCVDIDECQTNNGNCEMFCRNLKGGFRCECSEGYVIQKDKRSCKLGSAVQCRIPMPPNYGVMKCLEHRSDYGSLVPAFTKCNVWCNEGYKLEGRSQRVCNKAGIWEGEEPRCLVATCPSLPPIKHGWYLPGICNSDRIYLGEPCKVYCRKGFKRKPEFDNYLCGEDLQWYPPVEPERLQDACIREVPNTYIKCPGNGMLEFTLPTGQRHMFVKIPRPESNVDFNRYIVSSPSWGMRLETTLPVGRSEIRFSAMTPSNYNSSVSCNLVINVLDKESPRIVGCPDNIERTLLRGESMQIVHWREPTFYDNVGISSVYKSRESGSEFGPGLHHITYVANDEASNRAFCHFTVNVKDEPDSEMSNSIQERATYTNYHTAGRYKAVLICPSGVQYMSNSPDSYNNMITSRAGCHWEHIRVTRPMQPQSFKIPRVYSESRLPFKARANRREFFKWNR